MIKLFPSIDYSLFVSELRKVLLVIAVGAFTGWLFANVYIGIIIGLILYKVYLITVALRYHKALQELDFSDLPVTGKLLSSISENILGIHKKQRVLNKRLKRQVKSQGSMLDAWPDAMIVVDNKFIIQQYNKNATQWLDLSSNDKGQYVNNIIRESNFLQLLKNHQSTNKAYVENDKKHPKIIINSPKNPHQFLEVSIFDFIDNLYLLIFNDVTQRQNVARMRKDFIANISHELKTPLTSIKGFSELLAEEANEEQQLYVDHLINQTSRMDKIVQDLLKLSTLESALPPSDTKVIRLGEIIEHEIKLLRDLYQRVEINSNINKDLCIYGEKSEWQSLISNLLSNAVKHNEEAITIDCEWALEDDLTQLSTASTYPRKSPRLDNFENSNKLSSESLVENAIHQGFQLVSESAIATNIKDNSHAILTIRDNGIGVDKSVVALVTERFYRSDESRENLDGNKGTGLGLSIVKHVVERHNGKLIIESDINNGLYVQCVLPRKRIVG